ncbi:hypothetical protein BOW53_09610 [Solemya pervernicosa gill symbiont]|uniref:Uncharacterized protein n=1 Tax=Solemya pervernicosa gill symbiont TaxID=642797 RepID=A0A1T2L478_9GAMM|nr:hypothetical protein [Solemya pervernicosa gill symbiont]OOZ39915.1 hypothetical protein BOW53_09610 [Solemya pervernicosa gill symbiont]
MRNTYTISDFRIIGIPHIEVVGDIFHYQDLYELVGEPQHMTSFSFKDGSDSCNIYGKTVMGTIYYDKKTLKLLESAIFEGQKYSTNKIRIESPSGESLFLRKLVLGIQASSSFARALNYEYADGVDYRGLTALTSLSMAVSAREITEETRCDLKYGGISIGDIEGISFLPYKRTTEFHKSGDKRVPDIIEIEADCSGIDVDIINQSYLVK